MREYVACIFGSCGSVGSAAAIELQRRGFHLRLATRPESKNNKICHIARDGDDIVDVDVNDFYEARKFCRGADVVIGAAGPSFLLSEAMFYAACAEKVPYVDPGGSFLVSKNNLNNKIKIPSILAAGVFPGLSGLLIKLIMNEGKDQCMKLKVAVGGRYSFTKAASGDFVDESRGIGSGVPMACIRDGNIHPAENMEIGELPSCISDLKSFPYLSEEVQRISRQNSVYAVDSYTLMEKKVLEGISGISIKKDDLLKVSRKKEGDKYCSAIIVCLETKKSEIKQIFIGDEPGKVTGVISALAASHIVRGYISPGFYYCSDVFDPKNFMKDFRESMVFRYKKLIKR